MCVFHSFVTEHCVLWCRCLWNMFTTCSLCSRSVPKTCSVHIHLSTHTHTSVRTHKYEPNWSESNWDLIQWILTSKKTSTLSSFDCPLWAKASYRHHQLKSHSKHSRWGESKTNSINVSFNHGTRVSTTAALKWTWYYSHAYDIGAFFLDGDALCYAIFFSDHHHQLILTTVVFFAC